MEWLRMQHAAVRWWRALQVLGWVTGLALVVWLLGRAGQGPLAGPPPDPRSWVDWTAGRGPVEASFALLLLVVRMVACYLLAATALGVVASVSSRRRVAVAAARLSVPLVQRLVAGAVGVAVVGSLAGAAHPGERGGRSGIVLVTADPIPPGDPPVMHRLDTGPAPAPPPPAQPPEDEEWEVGPGDHLWSMAERALHEAWGRAPSDREVAPYWARVVDGNRARLTDPANPDLVFPGQLLVLPPPPPAP